MNKLCFNDIFLEALICPPGVLFSEIHVLVLSEKTSFITENVHRIHVMKKKLTKNIW